MGVYRHDREPQGTRFSESRRRTRLRPLCEGRATSHRPRFELLEPRVVLSPTIFTVDSTGSGTSGSGTSGTLPYVVSQANANSNTDGSEIEFDSSVFSSQQTITLGATLVLSETTGPELIDGPGAGLVTVSGSGRVQVFHVDESGVMASLTGLTITGGSTKYMGGGLYILAGSAVLTDCIITGNSADGGGGIYNRYGNLTVTGCTISSNSAGYFGGGGVKNNGTATLSDCILSGNTNNEGAIGGGGLLAGLGSTTTLTNCTISGNTAQGGGGVDSNGATSLTNCTVAANFSASNGGGLYRSSGTTTLSDCTISSNSAGTFGGGIGGAGGTVVIGNTIVAENTAGSYWPDAQGTFASAGHNLIGETGGSSGWVASDLTGTIAEPLNAEVAPLGNYGGPTQTMPLLYGSPAIDAGNNNLVPVGITTDQRGEPRFVNGTVDIGAYELQVVIAASFAVNTTADFSDPTDGKTSLREAIASANALPGHTITFDPTVFASARRSL